MFFVNQEDLREARKERETVEKDLYERIEKLTLAVSQLESQMDCLCFDPDYHVKWDPSKHQHSASAHYSIERMRAHRISIPEAVNAIRRYLNLTLRVLPPPPVPLSVLRVVAEHEED